jgi:hypothetical protein
MKPLMLLALLLYCVLVSGCATWTPPASPTIGEAIIVGDETHRKAFENRIAATFPDFEVTNAYLNCVQGFLTDCERVPPDGDNRLIYRFVREYPKIFAKFGKVWDKLQRSSGDGTPALLLTFKSAGKSDCTKTGCPNNPVCSDSCGRPCPAC